MTVKILTVFALVLHLSLPSQDTVAVRALFTSTPVQNQPSFLAFTSTLSKERSRLQWSVSGNEQVDRFEVEKSRDGRSFKLAALVFGTDLAATGHYWFLDSGKGKKAQYRIRLLTKDGTVLQSQTIITE